MDEIILDVRNELEVIAKWIQDIHLNLNADSISDWQHFPIAISISSWNY